MAKNNTFPPSCRVNVPFIVAQKDCYNRQEPLMTIQVDANTVKRTYLALEEAGVYKED